MAFCSVGLEDLNSHQFFFAFYSFSSNKWVFFLGAGLYKPWNFKWLEFKSQSFFFRFFFLILLFFIRFFPLIFYSGFNTHPPCIYWFTCVLRHFVNIYCFAVAYCGHVPIVGFQVIEEVYNLGTSFYLWNSLIMVRIMQRQFWNWISASLLQQLTAVRGDWALQSSS